MMIERVINNMLCMEDHHIQDILPIRYTKIGASFNKDIKSHDRTLIDHELLEMKIKKDNPEISHYKAHEMASEEFDYQREAAEYYDNLKKYKKKR